MSTEAMKNVSTSVLKQVTAEEKRHRAAEITAIRPAMTAYEEKNITAEEYESLIGETYADTLHRKFTYELQDAKEDALKQGAKGTITREEMDALVARADAAGAPEVSASSILQRATTVLTSIEEEQSEETEEA